MAVDSRTKRLSMLNFSIGVLLPDPSGTIDVGNRLTLLDLYRGIVPSAAVDRTPVVFVSQVFVAGATAAEVYSPGASAAEVFDAGATAAEVGP